MRVENNQCFIPTEALSVLASSCNDDTRPVLKGACIRNGHITCCNGYTLCTYKIDQGKDFPESIIKAEDIRVAGINRTIGGLIIEVSDSTYIINGKYNIITNPISGKFPEFNQLFSCLKPHKPLASIGLSKAVVSDLLNAIKSSGEDYVTIRVKEIKSDESKPFYSNVCALEFTTYPNAYSVGELKGLLMPCEQPKDFVWYSDTLDKENK